MFERDVVFIGGGHTHALVLHMLIMQPLPSVRVTLISDTVLTPYSGMLPGYMAGHYSKEQTHIDLHRLCQMANVRFIHDRVVGIDLDRKSIRLKTEADVVYDKVSINTGSTPNLSVPGAAEYAVGVKPVSQLTNVWQQLLANSACGHWAVVGGGAAGVEVVLAIAHRFAKRDENLKLSLVHSGESILNGYQDKVKQKAYAALKRSNVTLVSNFNVSEVHKASLVSKDDRQLNVDQSIWCTPASAPTWPVECGLATDEKGFIAVNEFLQSTSHQDVFACGDVATIINNPRPKAGVYAVRSAPFLIKNLTANLQQKAMTPVNLQKDFLSLVSLGNKTAVGQRNGIAFSGYWVWLWKDRIDRKFMNLFDLPSKMTMDANQPMHCTGCGSKLGPEILSNTLAELPVVSRIDVPNDVKNIEDAAVVFQNNHAKVWQSIDGFRAFTDNLYLLGKVSVYHALNDSYAMGLPPVSAQVWPNLAFSHPRIAARDFKRLMVGVTEALREHNTALTGGHTTEGVETHLGVVVTAEGQKVWPKNGAQKGDWVLLNKPLGTGILLAAQMQMKLSAEGYDAMWQSLSSHNLEFFTELQRHEVHAATDVTGFGLIGHALEMLADSDFAINLNLADVPCIQEAVQHAKQGVTSSLAPQLETLLLQCDVVASNTKKLPLLTDPQTNGGLLVSVDAKTGLKMVSEGFGVKIGEVAERQRFAIVIY